MEFTEKKVRPGVVVLAMTGSIRLGPNCQQIEHALDELIREGATSVIYDLSGVPFIDSAGIGTIVRGLVKLKKLGGALRLAGVKPMVAGVLKLTQIDRSIEIFATAEQAAENLPAVPPS